MTGKPKAKMFTRMAGLRPKKPQKLLKNKPEFKHYKEKRSEDRGTYEVNFKREVHSVIFKPLRLEGEPVTRDAIQHIDFPTIFEIDSSSTKDSTIPSCVEDDSESEAELIDYADIDDTDICGVVVEGSECDDEVHQNDRSETPSLPLAENIQSPDEACEQLVEQKSRDHVIDSTTENTLPQSDTSLDVAECKENPYHDDNDGKFDICELSFLRFLKSLF